MAATLPRRLVYAHKLLKLNDSKDFEVRSDVLSSQKLFKIIPTGNFGLLPHEILTGVVSLTQPLPEGEGLFLLRKKLTVSK